MFQSKTKKKKIGTSSLSKSCYFIIIMPMLTFWMLDLLHGVEHWRRFGVWRKVRFKADLLQFWTYKFVILLLLHSCLTRLRKRGKRKVCLFVLSVRQFKALSCQRKIIRSEWRCFRFLSERKSFIVNQQHERKSYIL